MIPWQDFLPTSQCARGDWSYLAPFLIGNFVLSVVFGILIPGAMSLAFMRQHRHDSWIFPREFKRAFIYFTLFIHFCGIYHFGAICNTFIASPLLMLLALIVTALFAALAAREIAHHRHVFYTYVEIIRQCVPGAPQ